MYVTVALHYVRCGAYPYRPSSQLHCCCCRGSACGRRGRGGWPRGGGGSSAAGRRAPCKRYGRCNGRRYRSARRLPQSSGTSQPAYAYRWAVCPVSSVVCTSQPAYAQCYARYSSIQELLHLCLVLPAMCGTDPLRVCFAACLHVRTHKRV